MKPLGVRRSKNFDTFPKATRSREATMAQRRELAAAHGQGDDLYFTDSDDIDYEAMEDAVLGLVYDLGEGAESLGCDACADTGNAAQGGKCPACFGFGRLPSNDALAWLRKDPDE